MKNTILIIAGLLSIIAGIALLIVLFVYHITHEQLTVMMLFKKFWLQYFSATFLILIGYGMLWLFEAVEKATPIEDERMEL